MTEPPLGDDLPGEEPHDPTGLELAAEIAHQTARTSPLLPEAAPPPPKASASTPPPTTRPRQ